MNLNYTHLLPTRSSSLRLHILQFMILINLKAQTLVITIYYSKAREYSFFVAR